MALARSIPTSLSLSLQSHKSLDPIDRRQLRRSWLTAWPASAAKVHVPPIKESLLAPLPKFDQICLHRGRDWISYESWTLFLTCLFSRSPQAVRSAFWLVRGAPGMIVVSGNIKASWWKCLILTDYRNLAKQPSHQSLRSILRLLQAIVKLLLLGWDVVIQSPNPSSHTFGRNKVAFKCIQRLESSKLHFTLISWVPSLQSSNPLRDRSAEISWPWRFPGQPQLCSLLLIDKSKCSLLLDF